MKILITGGTKGIGLALFKELLEGNQILVIARDTSALKKEYKQAQNASFLSLDLSNQIAVDEITYFVSRKWRKIDVIINNAATLSPKLVTDCSSSDIDYAVNVNFKSPVLLINSLAPYLSAKSQIINILSPAIFRNSKKIWLYVATKSALKAASEVFSQHLPVLMYYPGIINTSIISDDKSLASRFVAKSPEYTARKISTLIKNKRTGSYFEPVARLLQIAGILGF